MRKAARDFFHRRKGDEGGRGSGSDAKGSLDAPKSPAPPAAVEKHPDAGAETSAGIDNDSQASLWDTAYDGLDKKLVAEYETLLTRVLMTKHATTSPANPEMDAGKAVNEIPQHDTAARRERMKEVIALGLQHMQDKKVKTTVLGHELVLQDVVAQVAGVTAWAESYIKDAAKDLPYASIVVAGVSLVLPILKNPPVDEAENQAGFTWVTSQLRYYVAMENLFIPEQLSHLQREDLTARLLSLYTLIIEYQVSSVIRFYRSRTKNYFRAALKTDGWASKTRAIQDSDRFFRSLFDTVVSGNSLQQLKEISTHAESSFRELQGLNAKAQDIIDNQRKQLTFAQKLDQRMERAEDRECLQDFQDIDPRTDKKRIESAKGSLLRDSYKWVLGNESYQRWLQGDDDGQQQPVLWIRGDPGCGKTMLVCGIIDELTQPNPNGHDGNVAFFLCQASENNLNNVSSVLRGLIHLLVKQQPELIDYLRASYSGAGQRRFEGPNAFWTLADIMNSILRHETLRNTILVVDALDEVTSDEDLGHLLDFVAESVQAHSQVKWLLSSRNWSKIEEKLNGIDDRVELSLEQNEEAVVAAVNTFIQHRVDKLHKTKAWSIELRNKVLDHLSTNANNTFLWVALVCQALEKANKLTVERKLYAFPAGLQALYMRMFEQLRSGHGPKDGEGEEEDDDDDDDNETFELCRSILAIACIAYRPLTLDEMFSYVEVPESSRDDESLIEVISLCGSFLMVRERTVTFVHQSAADFLLSGKVAKDVFPAGEGRVHKEVSSKSITLMSSVLKQDIYGLKASGTLIETVVTTSPDPLAKIRYACSWFIDHMLLDMKTDADEPSWENVDMFLKTHFLHWLEALSLMNDVSRGIEAFSELGEAMRKLDSKHTLAAMISDMSRLVRSSRYLIERGPLQVYTAALLFSPSECITRTLFQHKEPSWVVTKPIMRRDWDDCLMTIEAGTDEINAIAFSPTHGSTIAVASTKIQIMDANNGHCFRTLPGHDGKAITGIAWSPDGKRLASSCADTKIWDVETQQCVLTIGCGADREIVWRGEVICTTEWDTVHLWNATTGAAIQSLHDINHGVIYVAWISETELAIALRGGQVVMWDTVTGHRINLLTDAELSEKPHSVEADEIAWSKQASRLFVGDIDGTISSWDVARRKRLSALKAHIELISSMSFSPSGKLLATGSGDNTIKVFSQALEGDATKLEEVSQFEHSQPSSLAWSSNEPRLASLGWDDSYNPVVSIKIWDTESRLRSRSSPSSSSRDVDITITKHALAVTCTAYSPDGTRVASGSEDKTIRIWDPATGQTMRTCQGHAQPVKWILWSRDGTRLLSTIENNKLWKQWDVATGNCVAEYDCRDNNDDDDDDDDKADPRAELDKYLQDHVWAPNEKHARSSRTFWRRFDEKKHLYDVSEDKLWVTRQGTPVLALPADFRPPHDRMRDSHGSKLAIGCTSGRVIFLEFAEEGPPSSS